MKHAPGPYRYQHDGHFIFEATHERLIAAVRPPALGDPSDRHRVGEDVEATGRLLAAAPELLETCRAFVSFWEEWAQHSDCLAEPLRRSLEMRVEEARAVLSKVTGGLK